MYAEVEAGIRVRTLCEELGALKLALPNLGATATQSIISAASTGTHGTGLGRGAIATQIVALRIIDASGKVHIASETENIFLFKFLHIFCCEPLCHPTQPQLDTKKVKV